jgi:hypothetical protein
VAIIHVRRIIHINRESPVPKTDVAISHASPARCVPWSAVPSVASLWRLALSVVEGNLSLIDRHRLVKSSSPGGSVHRTWR